jgi:exopolysaccharide biosynthesis polyprenyl glycosylphosphotransferase
VTTTAQPAALDADGRLLVSDVLAASAEPLLTPVRRVRSAGRSHRFASVLNAVHGAHHSWAPVLVDVAVLDALALGLRIVPDWWQFAFGPLVAAFAYLGQLYVDRDPVQTRGVLWYAARMCTPLAVVTILAVGGTHVPVARGMTLFALSLALTTGLRVVTWFALVLLRRRGLGLRRTLIVGDHELGALVWRRLVEFPEAGLVPVQLVGWGAAQESGSLEHELRQHRVQHVVLAAPGPREGILPAILPRHETGAPTFSMVPALAELFLDPHSVTEVGGVPLVPLGRVTLARRTFPGKRGLDLLLAGTALLLLLPVFAVVALVIKLNDGGSVFYAQDRVGRAGKVFRLWKFRSMVAGADSLMEELEHLNETDGLLFKIKSDPRITRVGRFLRKSSLDELPQLWNVLVGEMSLVGPRPLAVDPAAFTDFEGERHSVLPGITGYWQLSGGPGLGYAEMIRLDLAYVRNWSLFLDLRLMARTVPALLHRHGGH